MVAVVDFQKRIPPSAASRGTLAELMAKKKTLAEQTNAAAEPQQIGDWTQGVGNVLRSAFSGYAEGRAERSESEARDALAKIQATVGLEGATPEQLAEIGRYDPEIARQYREEAVQARRDAAARAEAGLDRNVQTRGQDVTATTAANQLKETSRSNLATEGIQTDQLTETGRSNRATEAIQGATQTETGRHNVAAEATDEATLAANAAHNKATETVSAGTLSETERANKAAEKAAADKAAADAAQPAGDIGKFMVDVDRFNKGDYGDPKDPNNQALFAAKVRQNTAVTKGTQFSFDPATGAFTFSEGGTDGGGAVGSTQDLAAQSKAMDTYRAGAQAANEALSTVDAMSKTLDAAGPTGPGGDYYASVDDALEAYGPLVGLPKDYTLPGTSGARAMLDVGSLAQQLEKVQKTTGSISNAEMDIFKRASAGQNKTPEANRLIIDMARALLNRANEKATRAEAWVADPKKGAGRLDGFEQDWNTYINANPVIGVNEAGEPVIFQGGSQPPKAEKAASEMTDEEIDAAIAAQEKKVSGGR